MLKLIFILIYTISIGVNLWSVYYVIDVMNCNISKALNVSKKELKKIKITESSTLSPIIILFFIPFVNTIISIIILISLDEVAEKITKEYICIYKQKIENQNKSN